MIEGIMNDFKDFFKKRIFWYKQGNTSCIEDAIKQMEGIKSMLEKGKSLTKILAQFGNDLSDRKKLLGNLYDIYISYFKGTKRSRLGFLRRLIKTKLSGNKLLDETDLDKLTNGAELDVTENSDEWKAYVKAGKGMMNMLHLLRLDKPSKLSWFDRLKIMQDKKYVCKDKIFKSISRTHWNDNAQKAAENLYKALLKVKNESIQGIDDLAILTQADVSAPSYAQPDGNFSVPPGEAASKPAGYRLYPPYKDDMKNKELKARIDKILCNPFKSNFRKFTLNGTNKYAIFPQKTDAGKYIIRDLTTKAVAYATYTNDSNYPGSGLNPWP